MPQLKDSARFGVAQRNHLGRADLAFQPKRKFDPLDVIAKACRGHVPRLIPVKFARMSESPFAFFRGAVEVMAADLGAGKHTQIEVQLCGDAHVKNFGFFAAPDMHVVLDVNDFDETQRGAWEWDVKRMAASIVVAGRFAGDGDRLCKEAAGIFLREYCTWIRRFAGMTALDVARHRALRETSSALVRGALKEAERSSPQVNLKKLTRPAGKNSRRFLHKPGLIWEVAGAEKKAVLAALPEYRKTLLPDHQRLFDSYAPADVGFKVVGTGSVGTRDYVVLMIGQGAQTNHRKTKDALFLQIKEESRSAYAPYYKDASAPRHQGQRVVQGQRALQVLSDLLLGWCTIDGRDYLVRQLNDHKSSIDPEKLRGNRLTEYSRICAELLAKGHARSGNPAALAAYLGNSPKAEKALLQFAVKYADQTEEDFQVFKKAMKKGFAGKVLKAL